MIDQDAPRTAVPALPAISRAEIMLTTFLGMEFSILSFDFFLLYTTQFLIFMKLMPARLVPIPGFFWSRKGEIGVCVGAAAIALFLAIYRSRQKGSASAWQKFDYWTTTIVRYFLAYIFLTYGLAKVFHSQFSSPLMVLDTRLADVGGFNLTWRFFGYSYAYALFIAGSQILCSALFFFRRTTTLGAAILIPIISNIVFVNFAFGVPVKFFSSIYLLMALFLLLPEWRRFKALFWDNTPIAAPTFAVAHFRMNRGLALLKATVILILVAVPLISLPKIQSHLTKTTTPLAGTWNVEQYKVNGQVQPASDSSAWKRLYVENDKLVEIRSGEGRPAGFDSTFDDAKHTLTIKPGMSESPFFAGIYQIGPDGTLTLHGQDPKHAEIEVTLTRVKNAR